MYANDRMQQLSGYDPDDLRGQHVEMLIPVDARQVHRIRRRLYVAQGPVRRDMGNGIATRLRRRDGTELPVDIALTPLFAGDQRVVLAAVRDMSDRQGLVLALEDSQRWLRSQSDVLEQVARNEPLEVTLTTLARAVVARSPAAGCTIHVRDDRAGLLRLQAAVGLDAEYQAHVTDVAPEGALSTNGDVPDVSGDPAWPQLAGAAESAGVRAYTCARVVKPGTDELIGIVGLHRPERRDASELEIATLEASGRLLALAVDHETARSALSYAATHDRLTGLPNRYLLLDRLARILSQRGRGGSHRVGIVFLDIDEFKRVNDSLGHSVGDRLLVGVGRRLSSSVRPGDMLARFGGDEFVVLCERVADELHVVRIAQRLVDSLHEPLVIDGQSITVNGSAGISIDAGHRDDEADAMIREADVAMYRAKARGGGHVSAFDTPTWERAVGRLGLESDLRRAIDGGELRLVYQPEVLLRDGTIVGAEALVRWVHPTRGLLGPDDFIRVAEQSALIAPLGSWVLNQACADAGRWQGRGLRDLVVSVNVSTRQLTESDFADTVRRALDAHCLEPQALCFEVTESAALDSSGQPGDMLARVREMGVRVALDDFGTGYASLSTLRTIPTDIVKIDRSFVAGLRSGRVERVLTGAVIAMARRLGIQVVAEGVETGAQARMLGAFGCAVGQGYLFARPLDADGFEEMLGQRGFAPLPTLRSRADRMPPES